MLVSTFKSYLKNNNQKKKKNEITYNDMFKSYINGP